jgi:glycosyltransferase involved in cell wall biosynthesis
MIYHAPYPLSRENTSASGIRPVRMLEAFRELGYQVLEVTGTSADRKRAIRTVKEFMREGTVDFAYSECSTMATTMTDSHHLPLHPFLDAGFFRYLKRKNVPSGVFYRDVHWRFPEYARSINPLVARIARMLYRFDLVVYRRWVDRVYVPSLQMAPMIPHVRSSQFESLPPGCVVTSPSSQPDTGLTLFYVGGVSDFIYRIRDAISGVARTDGARLILCTRREQWEDQAPKLVDVINDSIEVVHASGAELERYYSRATICSLYLEPVNYLSFAAPVKLYEYIGHGRPVIASEGTLSGAFVAKHNIGWTIPYSSDALTELLTRLLENPDDVKSMTDRVREERHNHTWLARARQVADGLTNPGAEREIA